MTPEEIRQIGPLLSKLGEAAEMICGPTYSAFIIAYSKESKTCNFFARYFDVEILNVLKQLVQELERTMSTSPGAKTN